MSFISIIPGMPAGVFDKQRCPESMACQKGAAENQSSHAGSRCAVASFSIPPAAAPGPELATRVMGPPSSRQEPIAPGAAPVQAPAPSPVIRALGPAVTSAASVPFAVCHLNHVDVPNTVPSMGMSTCHCMLHADS